MPERPADALPASPSSLPPDWEDSWGEPSPFYRRQLAEISGLSAKLANGIPLLALDRELGPLVGPADNAREPVHRWYSFKEAFSHDLPSFVCGRLGVKPAGLATDVFGGVATSALSLRSLGFDEVVGVEYSPFAHFVGRTKLDWPRLEPKRLARLIREALRYETGTDIAPPSLAAFGNDEIFEEERLHSLLAAREHFRAIDARPAERSFLLLGLAAVIEDASGAMKDGRALRILRGRERVSKLLGSRRGLERSGDFVRDALASQLWAMKEDLDDLAPLRKEVRSRSAHHLRGDARELAAVKISPRKPALDAGAVDFSLFSPPYLNCIDYSEVYKLELWLLEMISDESSFRQLRLGTLRSHPSVAFPDRGYLAAERGDVVNLVDLVSSFIERNHARAHIGRMVRNYFDDMYRVLAQQAWALAPGAWMVCVVGNSTFSRRLKKDGATEEVWRIPLLTDVILARMLGALGFEEVQIWSARDLRARNVRGGRARESAVVARRASGQ
jgi:roadblock/LC7 domain-containing protein